MARRGASSREAARRPHARPRARPETVLQLEASSERPCISATRPWSGNRSHRVSKCRRVPASPPKLSSTVATVSMPPVGRNREMAPRPLQQKGVDRSQTRARRRIGKSSTQVYCSRLSPIDPAPSERSRHPSASSSAAPGIRRILSSCDGRPAPSPQMNACPSICSPELPLPSSPIPPRRRTGQLQPCARLAGRASIFQLFRRRLRDPGLCRRSAHVRVETRSFFATSSLSSG